MVANSEEPTPQQLEDFEKALVWKCSSLIDYSFETSFKLGLLRQTDSEALVVLLPEDKKIIRRRGASGSLDYYTSIFNFSAKNSHFGLLSIRAKLGNRDFKKHGPGAIAGGFLFDDLDFGDAWRKCVLRFLWREVENGLVFMSGHGEKELPPPEKLLLEWSVASGCGADS